MAKRKQRRDEFQDISSYSSKQAYKKNQKKKKRTGLKVFLSFICVILVLVGGVMIYASTVLLGDLKTTTITKDKTELGISEETKSEAGITNIALFGVDARDYDGGTFAGRSDAIMVMSIDNVHHKVKLTSIMRDVRALRAKRPELILEVDGGVNRETAPICRENGADVAVAGTAVFRAENIPAEIALLRGE